MLKNQEAEIEQIWVRLQPFITGFYANLTCADQSAMKDDLDTKPIEACWCRSRSSIDPHNFFRLNPNIGPA